MPAQFPEKEPPKEEQLNVVEEPPVLKKDTFFQQQIFGKQQHNDEDLHQVGESLAPPVVINKVTPVPFEQTKGESWRVAREDHMHWIDALNLGPVGIADGTVA